MDNTDKKTDITYRPIRAIISGGGTGGHIFPAVSIAGALKKCNPDSEILFVGAEGKMEMEKVPAAGYKIVGLPIVGLQRQLSLKNIINDLQLPVKVIASVNKAKKIIRDFKPDIAIGVGGYASAPLLWAAQDLHIPCLIQEQNGFAGLANKILGKKAQSICVAYEGMEKFFPADRIVLSGNPIRSQMTPPTPESREEGIRLYGLDPGRKHLLILGGSLGSAQLNRSMKEWISAGCPGGEGIDILWQCGKYYKGSIDEFMKNAEATLPESSRPSFCGIHHTDFIARMDLAYSAADVVVSRSGASTVSELCAVHKAAIFVPSPNVAEDHQTHNAMALVRRDAAMIVKDSEAPEKLLPTAIELLGQSGKIQDMERNIAALALPDAAQTIADEVYRVLEKESAKTKS